MANILRVTERIFLSIFSDLAIPYVPIALVVERIVTNPYLLMGAVFLVIGFVVGIIKRLVTS